MNRNILALIALRHRAVNWMGCLEKWALKNHNIVAVAQNHEL